MSSIVCGATLATSAPISSALRRKLGGDHLSKRSENPPTAGSPRRRTSAMIPSTVARILASASSCWPASAAVLMCRGIYFPLASKAHHGGTENGIFNLRVLCVSVVKILLPGGPPAVAEQARAGDEGGGGRGEEDDRRRYFLDRADAAEWNAPEDPFAGIGVVEERLRQRGRDKGRGDRDDTHAFWREFDCHRLGQPFERVLGHHIDGAVALGADVAHLRRHVDDDAGALGDHKSGGGLCDDESCPYIQPEQQVEGRLI